MIEKMLAAITLRKYFPVCEHRDERTRTILSVLVEELEKAGMTDALQASEGLCLQHLRRTLEHVRDVSGSEKLENFRTELAEFIRKNDHQAIKEGFGSERDRGQEKRIEIWSGAALAACPTTANPP